jgi:hypothetical protein
MAERRQIGWHAPLISSLTSCKSVAYVGNQVNGTKEMAWLPRHEAAAESIDAPEERRLYYGV